MPNGFQVNLLGTMLFILEAYNTPYFEVLKFRYGY